MVFSDIQKSLGLWNHSRHKFTSEYARKSHICLKCAGKGFKVKMDYLGNRHEKSINCVYNVDRFGCPRCGQIYEGKVRIVGKGKSRNNLGKIAGGE